MNNPRLAARYAKSLLGLAIEKNLLEEVNADVRYIKLLCSQNPDFVAVLKSPIITADKKQNVIRAVLNESINPLTKMFIDLLIRKTRESNLKQIATSFITQYNELKNIHPVKITTATPISKEMKESILDRIRTFPAYQNIELETIVDESLIGGYKFEMHDKLIDATILRDLVDIKKQFMDNEYIQKLR